MRARTSAAPRASRSANRAKQLNIITDSRRPLRSELSNFVVVYVRQGYYIASSACADHRREMRREREDGSAAPRASGRGTVAKRSGAQALDALRALNYAAGRRRASEARASGERPKPRGAIA